MEPLDQVIAAIVRVPPIMTRRVHREIIRPALEEAGIDFAPHHMGILKSLENMGEAHVSEIGDMMGIARAQMTKSVDTLISSGMVEREFDTQDRRKINIRLTKKGRDIIKQIDKSIESRMRAKLASFSKDELKKLADSFNYIADTFDNLR